MLSADQVRGLARHIGYGNPAAPLWFVGGEEGLGGHMNARERAENLVARAEWEPIMDMAAAHRTLKEAGGYIGDLIDRPGSTIVWRFMARIARAFDAAPGWDDADEAANYVRNRLGATDGETFLTELSPFPSRRARQPIELEQFSDRELIDRVRTERSTQQIVLLHQHRPRVIICYGTGLLRDFEKHFGINWEMFHSVSWISKKSGAQQRTPIYRSEIVHVDGNISKAFLLPFLGFGAFSVEVLRGFVETAEFRALNREDA